MTTFFQLIRKGRKTKQFRSSTPKFNGHPYKVGTCVHVSKVKPKKPNSAQRPIAKVELKSGKFLLCHIPGFGHRLGKHSEILIRGGRVRDMPGVGYRAIRQKKDLMTPEKLVRTQRRSKYGLKKPKDEPGETRRYARKRLLNEARRASPVVEPVDSYDLKVEQIVGLELCALNKFRNQK
jgi:small subunit ribosomal protein S12